jgi:nicotinate-nucleotide pyrophosphorylase (carboxylating)
VAFIRNSHTTLTGSITAAMEQARQRNPDLQIVVQVQTWEELDETLPLEPDRIRLDGMPVQDIQDAVKWVAGRVPLEVSGAITLDNVRAIAETGVDYVFVASLTQQIRPLCISLRMV